MLHILCFGDSLTVGYQAPTPAYQETPYGEFLQHLLGARAKVSISGVCGELTSEMVTRFPRDVITKAPHYVVILGGTNDLGREVPPPDILENLLAMYTKAQLAKIQPVAVTVPSIRPEGTLGVGDDPPWVREHIAKRQHLNRLLAEVCSKMKIACVDLFGATLEPGTLLLAPRYSNDGLHLTTEGYRRLAILLRDEVFI